MSFRKPERSGSRTQAQMDGYLGPRLRSHDSTWEWSGHWAAIFCWARMMERLSMGWVMDSLSVMPRERRIFSVLSPRKAWRRGSSMEMWNSMVEAGIAAEYVRRASSLARRGKRSATRTARAGWFAELDGSGLLGGAGDGARELSKASRSVGDGRDRR